MKVGKWEICEWFALCTNDAAGTVTHPILGEVPTCDRCALKFNMTFTVRYTDDNGTVQR